jgi:hypothetical protein
MEFFTSFMERRRARKQKKLDIVKKQKEEWDNKPTLEKIEYWCQWIAYGIGGIFILIASSIPPK